MPHPHVSWIPTKIWQEATPIEIVSHIHHKIWIAGSSLGPTVHDCKASALSTFSRFKYHWVSSKNPTEHTLTPMFTFDWMMFLQQTSWEVQDGFELNWTLRNLALS